MPTDTLTVFVVSAIATGTVGALSFFAQRAFSKLEVAVEGVSGKLDALATAQGKADGDRRVLERDLAELGRRLDALDRELERLRSDVSEGVVR